MRVYLCIFIAQLEVNRPWDGDAITWQDGAHNIYNKSKFQVINSDNWAKACAIEWMGRVAVKERKAMRDVTLKDVQGMWRGADPHTAIEAHLPGFISTEYIDKIYITKEAEKSLPEALKRKYADVLVVTNNSREDIFLSMEKPAWFPPGRGYSFYVKPGTKCVIPVNCSKYRAISFVHTPAPDKRIRDLSVNFLSSLGQANPDAVCWIRGDDFQFNVKPLSLSSVYSAYNDGKSLRCYIYFENSRVILWCNGSKKECPLAYCKFIYFDAYEFDGVITNLSFIK